MRSILGQKIGMTQVFTENGYVIPVTVIKVEKNVVTNVLTNEKNGYQATQLAISDYKKSKQKKPAIGHFQKANTVPKKFVKEIRGMTGYKLGQIIDSSIFDLGELVDVIGVSKGKGFSGAIKRHNQKIGPKSHGGGGGSKPVRQTGSLGEIKSNKVNKGMTMPGHMGHERVTVQNLEVINIDVENEFILVKGSIPGPKKSFVIIREAVKGLKSHDPVKLVNLAEAIQKNKLLEEAKKHGANVNTDMTLQEMKNAVKAAEKAKIAAEELVEVKDEAEKLIEQKDNVASDLQNTQAELEKVLASEHQEGIALIKEKVKNLEALLSSLQARVNDAKSKVTSQIAESAKAETESQKLQVEAEKEEDTQEKEVKGGQ